MADTCVDCNYDLTGSPDLYKGVRTCPECGKVNIPGEKIAARPISPAGRAVGWIFAVALLSVVNVPVMWAGAQASEGSNPLQVAAYVGLGFCILEGLACAAITRRAGRPVWPFALVWLGLTGLLSFTSALCMTVAVVWMLSTWSGC